MSVTLESALDNSENNEQFGLNLELASDTDNHSGYRTVFGKPEARKKVARKAQGVSDVTLVKLATVGLVEGLWSLFLYLNLWYVIYPTLLFSSVFMSQILLKPDLATLTPIRLVGALVAGCAGLYYAYYLLTTFIFENSDPVMYADERPHFLFRICMYALVMWVVLYSSDLLNVKTLFNPEIQKLFFSFYLLYVLAANYLRYMSNKITFR
jgi:hypothetical protein